MQCVLCIAAADFCENLLRQEMDDEEEAKELRKERRKKKKNRKKEPAHHEREASMLVQRVLAGPRGCLS